MAYGSMPVLVVPTQETPPGGKTWMQVVSLLGQNLSYRVNSSLCPWQCFNESVALLYFLQLRRGRAVSPPHCLFGPWRKNLLSAFDTVNWQKENRNPPRFPTKNWRELQVKTVLIVSLRKTENCKVRSKVYAIGWFQTLNFWPIVF